jgi:hypothetical protein
MSCFGSTCGRRPGKNFLTFCSIGRVRSRVRPVTALVWPLALMLCADRVPNKNAHFRSRALTQAGSPDLRNDRICITSSALANWLAKMKSTPTAVRAIPTSSLRTIADALAFQFRLHIAHQPARHLAFGGNGGGIVMRTVEVEAACDVHIQLTPA